MRSTLLLAAWALLAGCANGRIVVTGHRDAIRFDFDKGDEPVLVTAIEIFEWTADQRDASICELKALSRNVEDLARFRSWSYGHTVAKYTTVGCPALIPGRRYGANVFHNNCMLHIDFTLDTDGTVRPVGRGHDGCHM